MANTRINVMAESDITPDRLREACRKGMNVQIDYIIDFQVLAHVCKRVGYDINKAVEFSNYVNGDDNVQLLRIAESKVKEEAVKQFLDNKTDGGNYVCEMRKKYGEIRNRVVDAVDGGVKNIAIIELDYLLRPNHRRSISLDDPYGHKSRAINPFDNLLRPNYNAINLFNAQVGPDYINSLARTIGNIDISDVSGNSATSRSNMPPNAEITATSLQELSCRVKPYHIDHIIEFQMLAHVCRRCGYNLEQAKEFSKHVNNHEYNHNLQVLTQTDNQQKRKDVKNFLDVERSKSPLIKDMKEIYETNIRGSVVKAEGGVESKAIKELDRLFAKVGC